ncbi:DUF3710 domain-containing protein [Gordonia sp. (in: high G+C Gram-positive bacteria)]|uniref:DUF3710 domain-containing protein n=1 Tax=Gordonia sp. (in: high G+C Gram-positive bacteria) TaxID=84139 RepID=UPI0016AE98B6|nr:DUF3710 domain-containing protein [Gordonia sp. (in: high G+C Gram-positive bacteria)]NLG48331.1 DUF3710 domain-containing protein [Gordonia sp. (in: high G+C Gram-positive bacteria)]
MNTVASTEKYSIGDTAGPYDIADLATSHLDLANSHLDLGSVLMPVVEGGQVTVEMSASHEPEAVYLVTPVGRIGLHAFAAPRSGGQWREVVRELAESLRSDGAQTSIEDGHWGREVIARVPGGSHRFIGVDGARWMVRCVASGPEESEVQLAQLARAVLAETVVRRGNEPYPPRELLPIVLPPVLAEQVAAAQQQMVDQAAQEAGVEPETGAFASRPLSDAPSRDSRPTGEVIPGGAVAQSASATIYTEDDGTSSDETSADAAGSNRAEIDEPDAVRADEDAPAPSSGSAMSRFRRRRR